MARFPKQNHG